MDILERIRNTRPENLVGIRSDFDDLPRGHFSAAKDTGMTRIVEGADDLVHPNAGGSNRNAGMVRIPSDDELASAPHIDGPCDNPKCCPNAEDRTGLPTVRQQEFITSLTLDLMELDAATWQKATDYNRRMTENRAWETTKGANASRWITNLKAKLAELRAAAPKSAPIVAGDFPEIPDGHYAVLDSGPDDWKFYSFTTAGPNSRFPGRRYLKVQASDEFHLIRNAAHRRAILVTIGHVGVKESQAEYGKHIGRCGRCHRTLTDELSRSRGIGPDCWEKM